MATSVSATKLLVSSAATLRPMPLVARLYAVTTMPATTAMPIYM